MRPAELCFVAWGLALLMLVSGTALSGVSRAQDSYTPSKVFNVAAQPSGSGALISIESDLPLGIAQTWQDGEGYHLVFPNTFSTASMKGASGVRMRRVGTSLEVLFQTRPGARVGVKPNGNRVQVSIDSPLDARPLDGDSRYQPNNWQQSQDPAASLATSQSSGESAHNAGNWSPPIGPVSDLPPEPFPHEAPNGTPNTEASDTGVQGEDESVTASVFSGTSVVIVMALGVFGLIVSRKLRSRQVIVHTGKTATLSGGLDWDDSLVMENLPEMRSPQKADASSSLVKANGAGNNGSSQQSIARVAVAGPTSLYGAYRIDQEVGKLILGQPHRMDVLASRAVDDRRAIETSLIKSLNSFELDESAHRRARVALEEYGFVARQCAALLLSPDPFDRTSAARCLGEIKSEAALPFLLESLYDSESIVRNQAVVSIGELRMPSAIGALLDIARTHPDVPSALLSRTLSACSVEGLDFFDAISESAQFGMGHEISVVGQITHLEPVLQVEGLPATCDNEQFAQALLELESVNVQHRSEAVKTLSLFRVQSSVNAIAQVARYDTEPNIRSIAVASLSAIDHESVFPSILISMADDTREVRASAARALNRLSFDRADAYVRVIDTSDEKTLKSVAQACIQAGIVSQNLDRLSSSDHRQAYETFALICLLAKANMYEPVLNAITEHSNLDVSLAAVHLLAATGQSAAFEQLRQLADTEGMCEEVRTAILQAMYKLNQAKTPKHEPADARADQIDAKVDPASTAENGSDAGVEFPFNFQSTQNDGISDDLEAEVQLRLDELEL